MISERLSKSMAFSILRHYYNVNQGVYSLLRKHGIILKTGAKVKMEQRKFYIMGDAVSITDTLDEVLRWERC